MQAGGRSVGRLFALLACYTLAGVAWSNTVGCREEDCDDMGPLEGTLACGVGEPDPYTPIINGGGQVTRTVVEGDSCLTASPSLVSWGALCECTSQPGCDGATDCSTQGGHCVANFCPTFSLRIGFTGPGQIERVGTQTPTDFSFGCRATGGLCVAEACQDLGKEVRFEAKPHPGAVIESWTGSDDCEDGVVALDANVECEVHFGFPEIQMSVSGSGQVVVPPHSEGCREGGGPELCTGAVAIDSYQTLRAIADPGNHLTAWHGACSGDDPEVVLTMDGDKSCAATFSTVSVGSGGSGVIEIVSRADDESLGDNGVYDRNALSCSADFSVISFASAASNLRTGASVPAEVGSSFARNRRDPSSASDDTTQQIHPPRVADPFTDRAPTSLSADGRYAAYQYTTGSIRRVYRRDLASGAVELISTSDPADSGLGLDDQGYWPQISGNGRFVAYRGQIPAYPGDPTRPGFVDGFIVRDTCTGAPPAAGCVPHSVGVSYDDSAPDSWYLPFAGSGVDISHDGRFVLFAAVPSAGGVPALYVHDRDEDGDGIYDEDDGTATVAAVELSDAAQRPFFLDASGRYVAFQSTDPTLPGNASPPFYGHAFLRDTCAGAPADCTSGDVLLSVQQDGQPVGDSPYGTQLADLSASGRYAAFASDNQLLFANEELEEYLGLGEFAVVRDTCVGAPADCTPANRLVSRRTDGEPVVVFESAVRVSDDGSLALFFGQRDALISQPGGVFAEVLLAVTGFTPEPGGTPVIHGRSPSGVSAGSPEFLLRVTGAGFVPGATVTWSTRHPVLTSTWITRTLATTFVSPQRLEAHVSGDDVDEAGLVLVRVANPGGTTSSPVSFTVSGS